MRNQTGINENQNQVLTPKKTKCPTSRTALPLYGGDVRRTERVLIMKNKDFWKTIIQVVVSILTAALTALGTTSCMKGML